MALYFYSIQRFLDKWFGIKSNDSRQQTKDRGPNAHNRAKEKWEKNDEQKQHHSKSRTENQKHKNEKNFEALLGVDQTSTLEEITAAYRRRIKIVHPDRFNSETNPNEWQQANQMLQELNDAYYHIKERLHDDSSPNTYGKGKRTEPTQEKESDSSTSYSQKRVYPQKGVTTCLIKNLTLNHVEFIKNLKNNSNGVSIIKTYYVIWRYLGLLIAGLIYTVNVWSWGNLTYVIEENFWLGVFWLFFLSLVMAKCALTIYSYHRAKIKPCLIITPIYCIEIFRNKVTFFYTWEIDSYTFYEKFPSSYLKIKIGGLTKKIRLPGNFKFENYMKLKSKVSGFEKFWNTISDPADWLATNDILRDVKSRTVGRIPVAALNIYSFSLVATTMVCIILSDSFTLVDKNYFARQQLKNHALRESSRRSYGNKKVSDVPIVFNQPLQPLPFSGKEFFYTNEKGVAPLNIKVPSLGAHYYIKIVHAYTERNIKSVFIRSGGKVETTVPLGRYKVKYATGVNWYGREYLFGPKTQVAICDEDFNFTVEEDQVKGYTLDLIKQQGGNLHTSLISLDDF